MVKGSGKTKGTAVTKGSQNPDPTVPPHPLTHSETVNKPSAKKTTERVGASGQKRRKTVAAKASRAKPRTPGGIAKKTPKSRTRPQESAAQDAVTPVKSPTAPGRSDRPGAKSPAKQAKKLVSGAEASTPLKRSASEHGGSTVSVVLAQGAKEIHPEDPYMSTPNRFATVKRRREEQPQVAPPPTLDSSPETPPAKRFKGGASLMAGARRPVVESPVVKGRGLQSLPSIGNLPDEEEDSPPPSPLREDEIEPSPLPSLQPRNPALLAQRSMQASQDAIKNLIRDSFQDLETKLDDMNELLGARLSKCEEVLEKSLKFMASTMTTRPKESTIRVSVTLAPINNIYSGVFYTRMFGMVFIITVMNELRVEREKRGEEGSELEALIASGQGILHAILYRRLPSEKNKKDVTSSRAFTLQNVFARDLCFHMITTAQNNDTVGVERFVYKDKFEEVPRPFWLRPNFVRKRIIDEVVMGEDGGEEDLARLGKKVRSKKQEAASGSIMAEMQDREELARGIVDRVNTRNKQYMNKSRENARADFLSKIGFLWHLNGNPHYDSTEIPELEDEDLDSIPTTNVYPSEESPVDIR